MDICAAVRWHQKSRQAGSWWGAGAPQPLPLSKWELRGVGRRSFAAFVGPAPTALYTLLARRQEPHRLLMFTAGVDPPLAVFHVEESATGGLLGLLGSLAVSSATHILGRAKGFVPGGLRRSGSGVADPSGAPQQEHLKPKNREKIGGAAAAQHAAVWDDKRSIATVSLSPW